MFLACYLIYTSPVKFKQVVQLSQRDRAAGWVSYGQKWNWEIMLTDKIGLSSTTVTRSACNAIKFCEKKTQNKGYYAVQGHSRSSKSVSTYVCDCDFLLVTDSN